MPRDLRARENQQKAKARRQHALDRLELGRPTEPRKAAAGPVSHAIKVIPPDVEAALAAFRASRPKGD